MEFSVQRKLKNFIVDLPSYRGNNFFSLLLTKSFNRLLKSLAQWPSVLVGSLEFATTLKNSASELTAYTSDVQAAWLHTRTARPYMPTDLPLHAIDKTITLTMLQRYCTRSHHNTVLYANFVISSLLNYSTTVCIFMS
jgi:hypothetical protein